MDQSMNEPEVKELVRKARFPVRLRETDVEAPGLGVDAQAAMAWENKRQMIRREVGKQGVTYGIVGPRGTGKSQMGVAIGRELCGQTKPVLYVRAAWLFVQVRSTYQPAAERTEEQAILDFLKPRLLIIDEVDKRKGSDAEDMLLENIVCGRHDDGKDTLLISNLKKAEFEASVGESIVSRMCQGGGVVVCDWGSFRTGH